MSEVVTVLYQDRDGNDFPARINKEDYDPTKHRLVTQENQPEALLQDTQKNPGDSSPGREKEPEALQAAPPAFPALSSLTVSEIRDLIAAESSSENLDVLERLEVNGKNRQGVLRALAARRDELNPVS